MEEYVALREEIISNSQIVANFLAVSVTAAVAILGFGLQSERRSGLLMLTPFLLTIPSLWFITSQLESSIRIATYIKTRIEPAQRGAHWETALAQIEGRALDGPDARYVFAIASIYRIIGVICALLAVGLAVKIRWQRTAGTRAERLAALGKVNQWLPLAAVVILSTMAFLVQEYAIAGLNTTFTDSYAEYVKRWHALQAP